MHIAEPLGHASVLARLWRAAREGHLPHAILFEGPSGIGKFMAMGWFAAGLLCAEGPGSPCATCGPCKRVRSGGAQGNHGDLFTIDPIAEGEERIRVARIAYRSDGKGAAEGGMCLESFLDLCAVEGGFRAVLIRNAERMNEAAQNALLKTLEEPRPGTVLLLETHRPMRLLTTLRSRCIRVRLKAPGPAECRGILEGAGLSDGESEALARWTEGSPGRALAWKRRGAEALRSRLLDCMGAAGADAKSGGAGRTTSPMGIATELWELEGEFDGEKPTQRARDRARFVLDLALALLFDQLRASHGVPAGDLPHGAAVEALAARGLRPDPLSTRRSLDQLLVCRGDVDRNLTPEAVVERALLILSTWSTRSRARALQH